MKTLKNMACVYGLQSPVSDEIRYIGKTIQVEKNRLIAHISDAKRKPHRTVCKWVNSLSPDRPRLKVLFRGAEEQVMKMEKVLIAHYKQLSNLTNSSRGGETGMTGGVKSVFQYSIKGKFIKEWEGIRMASIFYNIHRSVINRACKGERNKVAMGCIWRYNVGQKAEDIPKSELKEILRRKRNPNLIKIPRTKEQRAEMSRRAKQDFKDGKREKIMERMINDNPMFKLRKPVFQYDLDGNFIKGWDCAVRVYEELGFGPPGILDCCKNKHKQWRGFVWSFKYVGDRLSSVHIESLKIKEPVSRNKFSSKQEYEDWRYIRMKNNNPAIQKAVVMLDKKGNKIKEFESSLKAGEYVGRHPSNISRCCNGLTRYSYGFKWEFKTQI